MKSPPGRSTRMTPRHIEWTDATTCHEGDRRVSEGTVVEADKLSLVVPLRERERETLPHYFNLILACVYTYED